MRWRCLAAPVGWHALREDVGGEAQLHRDARAQQLGQQLAVAGGAHRVAQPLRRKSQHVPHLRSERHCVACRFATTTTAKQRKGRARLVGIVHLAAVQRERQPRGARRRQRRLPRGKGAQRGVARQVDADDAAAAERRRQRTRLQRSSAVCASQQMHQERSIAMLTASSCSTCLHGGRSTR